MKISQKGIDLIKHFEGLRLTPYKDAVGVSTVGYGHTGPDVQRLGTITEQTADELLHVDLAHFEAGVTEEMDGVTLRQNEFDALVCLVFNIGLHNFSRSTLCDMLWSGQHTLKEEADEFLRWNHAGGKVLPGLAARREAEAEMFRGSK